MKKASILLMSLFSPFTRYVCELLSYTSLRLLSLPKNHDLIRNATLALASTLISSAISLVSAPILAWLLSRDEYGTLAYIGSITGLVIAFSVPGVSNAISYGVARGFEGVFQVGSKYRLRIYLRNSLLLLPVACWYFWEERNPNFSLMLVIAAILLPWSNALDTSEQFLVGRSDFGALFWRRLAVSISVAFSGVGVALFWPTALAVFTGRSLVTAILTISIFFLISRILKNKNEDPEFWPKTKAFNKISILGSTGKLTDRLVLGKMGIMSDLAAYSLAISMCAPMEVLGKSVIKLVFGRLKDTRSLHDRHMMILLSVGTVVIGVPAILALLNLFGPWIVLLFPKYPEIISYMQIILVASIFYFANALPHTYALFHNNRAWETYYIWRNAIIIPLTAIVVFLKGVWGALYLQLGYAMVDYLFFIWLLWITDKRKGPLAG